jgi:hypothetical protein
MPMTTSRRKVASLRAGRNDLVTKRSRTRDGGMPQAAHRALGGEVDIWEKI